MRRSWILSVLVALALALSGEAAAAKIVFVAGTPSHPRGEHEHRAGSMLLAKSLSSVPNVETVVVTGGFPEDTSVFDGASTIVIYADGGARHPAVVDDNLATLAHYMDQGVGLVCLHYAVEVETETAGPQFLDWIGGYFELNRSVNPIWVAHFTTLPDHPITRGVHPFATRDEWYFNMHFPDGMKNVTPILTAVPPESTMSRPDGPREGNPGVRELVAQGLPQHMAWAIERPDGGRGFGFAGGHYHKNWQQDDVRKLVLNAILWTAHVEVPEGGVVSSVSLDDVMQNLDEKRGPEPSMVLEEFPLEQ